MASVTVRERFRPARIAFVFPAGDAAAFELCVQMNTALLGGMFNPIVGFDGGNGKDLVELLHAFDPDLVHSESGASLDWLPPEFSRGYPEHYRTLYRGRDRGLGSFIYQDVAPMILELWREVARFDRQSRFVYPVLPSEPGHHLFFKTVFGSYPHGFALDYARMFREHLNPYHLPLGDTHPYLTADPEDRVTPIGLTVEGLHQYCPNRLHPTQVVYVGDPTDVESLADFWNLRAAGNVVLFVPGDAYGRYEHPDQTVADRGRMGRAIGSTAVVCHRTVPSAARAAIGEWLASPTHDRPRVEIAHSTPSELWTASPPRVGRYRYAHEAETSASISQGAFEYHTVFPNWLLPERPTLDEKFVCVTPTFRGLSSETNYLSVFPPDPSFDQIVTRVCGGFGRVSTEGLAALRTPLHRQAHVQLPLAYDAIRAIFEYRNMTIRLSEPGHVAQQVIGRLGGIAGCRILKVPAVRAVIDLLNDGKARPRKELLRTIGEHWSRTPEGLYVEPDRLFRRYKPAEVIDLMHRLTMIEQGWQLKCETCSMYGWYPLRALAGTFDCLWCFASQPTPQLVDNPNVTYAYRANGLFLAHKKMKGSVPVIVSLWRLVHAGGHLERSVYLPSVGVHSVPAGDELGEIDFVVLTPDRFRSSDYGLVLGEARGMNDYGADEVEKIRRIADRFGSEFTKRHILFCFSTLKEAFSDAEKDALRGLVASGHEVLPLTRLDLDPYDLFERFDGLPDQYSQTLDQLARNARQVNLTA